MMDRQVVDEPRCRRQQHRDQDLADVVKNTAQHAGDPDLPQGQKLAQDQHGRKAQKPARQGIGQADELPGEQTAQQHPGQQDAQGGPGAVGKERVDADDIAQS